VNRTAYLVDGFNLYHSLVDAQRDSHGVTAKWLDLTALCMRFLKTSAELRGEPATLVGIYYFSAMPTHRSADQQARHALYMRCLVGTGVHVSLSQFKRHKEKETDVAIASKLFELCYEDSADCVVLVTGDTDLAPAIRTCQRLFPKKTMIFALPYLRANDELRRLARGSFKIRAKTYSANQFPDPLILPDGTVITKPGSW
jgi:uncharacterized LabA/DUF88 family protein